MSEQLTQFQKQLCSLLQGPLPLHSRPFAEIAKALDSEEQIVLKENILETRSLLLQTVMMEN